jgi:hypothetical protein
LCHQRQAELIPVLLFLAESVVRLLHQAEQFLFPVVPIPVVFPGVSFLEFAQLQQLPEEQIPLN